MKGVGSINEPLSPVAGMDQHAHWAYRSCSISYGNDEIQRISSEISFHLKGKLLKGRRNKISVISPTVLSFP